MVGLSAVAGRRQHPTRSASPSGWAWPRRCSATRPCCCSTSRSTGWTRRASGWIRGLLGGLAAQGRTVFMSSHLIDEIARPRARWWSSARLLARTAVAELSRQAASLEDAFLDLTSA